MLILDLDGTICDDRHRRHFIPPKMWTEYHALIPMDEPHMPTVRMAQGFTTTFRTAGHILIVTGRPERYRQVTMEWLTKHTPLLLSETDTILMRPDDDFRQAPEVKVDLLKRWAATEHDLPIEKLTGKEPWAAIDDHEGVCDAYAALGITTFNINFGARK